MQGWCILKKWFKFANDRRRRMKEMCQTKGSTYFQIIISQNIWRDQTQRLSLSSLLSRQWMSGTGITHYVRREGRLSWMRIGRSEFKTGLWEVTSCDPSLPGHLWSISLHSGHAESTKQGRYCMDMQPPLGMAPSLCWQGCSLNVRSTSEAFFLKKSIPGSLMNILFPPMSDIHCWNRF